MKHLFFSVIVSAAVLLSAISYGQYKYSYKPKAVTSVVHKKTYSNTNRVNATISADRLSSLVTDPPIINDPIDIYAGNPVLLKASLFVHFGDVNGSGLAQIELFGSPDYFYHGGDHIRINSIDYSNIRANLAREIPLYTNSDNHWTVTYQDFVDKWVDSAHTHRTFDDRARMQGGSISLYQAGLSGTINKLILVLKFASGTETIVWDKPKAFNVHGDFKFDQNFDPIIN